MLIRKQRLDRGLRAMREQQVDMWIAVGRDLQHEGEPMLSYLLTFAMSGPVAVILTSDGERVAVNSPMEIEELESMGIFSRVVANKDGYAGMQKLICELIREKIRGLLLSITRKRTAPPTVCPTPAGNSCATPSIRWAFMGRSAPRRC